MSLLEPDRDEAKVLGAARMEAARRAASCESSAGRWDADHALWAVRQPATPMQYGDPTTYAIAATWLDRCPIVEDWGAGLGGFTLYRSKPVRGVDGSPSPWVATVADLAKYRLQKPAPGLLMRHVLEHNHAWEEILDNALQSFFDRMALIVFTPFTPHPSGPAREIAWNEELGIPDISLPLYALGFAFDAHDVSVMEQRFIKTDTQYGGETVFLLER